SAVWAKTIVGGFISTRQNSEKYVLLGDPALEVRYGRSPIVFETATVDSTVTEGTLRVVRGSVVDEFGNVLDGVSAAPAFNGRAFVHVSGQADTSGYTYDTGAIAYDLEGPTTFRGEVPVTNGRFVSKFFLSEAVETGNRGRISVFALENGATPRDASGSADTLSLAPTISPGQVEDGQGPRIQIRFEGYDNFVNGDFVFTDKPILVVEIEDESGVNPLPFPEFAQLSAKVDQGEQIDLADDFTYDSGSFTRGRVRRILPLTAGEHTLEVKAFDNVGNRGSAEISFTVVLPSAEFEIVDRFVAVYPNPFPTATDFLFRLTHDAEVNLKIFTTSGRKIYETGPFNGIGGENRVRWDGRDERGRSLANGTYLYKVEASYTNGDGQLESDEFVGHVVKMR
ncbi:MAG: T9SS type A sorting domain-containing protein, partial [Gemmatimonadetes bacterium]|nr:T9SS type A sorting domain-containing protein [Gemmatimonadota bacterium]